MKHEEVMPAYELDRTWEEVQVDGTWYHLSRVEYEFEDVPYNHPEQQVRITYYKGAFGPLADRWGALVVAATKEVTAAADDGCCKHGKYVGGMGADLMCHYCEMGYTDEEYAAHLESVEERHVTREHVEVLKKYNDEVFGWVVNVCSEVGKDLAPEIFTADVVENLKAINEAIKSHQEV